MTEDIQKYPLPPIIPGTPFIGHGLKMQNDIWGCFTELYQEHGEIVRVKILGKAYTVMAGLAANQWFVKHQDNFRNREIYASQVDTWDAPHTVIAADGETHRILRRASRRTQSAGALAERMPDVTQMVTDLTDTWQVGQSIPVWRMWQLLVTDQVALVTANRGGVEHFDDLQRFFKWTTYVDLGGTMPKWFLRLPRFRNSIRRLEAFAGNLIAEHREARAKGEMAQPYQTIIDDLLDAQAENPEIWPESVLIASTIAPFIAGMDTVASTMSFALYLILNHPEIYEQIQAEVDSAFADGTPLTEKKLSEMPILNGAVHETLRLYPIGAATLRVVDKAFVYNGYRVEEGSLLYVANAVPHFLEEYYPDPQKFDPTRPMKPPVPFSFSPFSIGVHTCLGSAFARLQILINLAMMFHHVRLEIDPKNYQMKAQASPIPNTGHDLKVKVVEKRQVAVAVAH